MDLLEQIIELAIQQAREDRNAVNSGSFDLEEKRAVAMTVTKLEEAQMWKEKAFEYYNDR